MSTDPLSLDFTPFHILCAHGQQYCGVRPSMIPKPFKSAVVVLNGQSYKPGLPDGCSLNNIVGFDAAIRVGITMEVSEKSVGTVEKEDRAYRLITLMKDGRKWSKLIYLNGNIEEDWL